MDDSYFNERRAATYDDDAEMFDPAVVDPVSIVLVKLSGDGSASSALAQGESHCHLPGEESLCMVWTCPRQ